MSWENNVEQQPFYVISAAIFGCTLLMGALVGGGSGLVGGMLLAFLIQWLAFLPAMANQDERAFDAVGASTFLVVMAHSLSLGAGGPRQVLVSCLVAIWAVRLGTFLFSRTHRRQGDARFAHIKTNPAHFFMVWTLQGMWVSITALAAMVINAATPGSALGLLDYIGTSVWVIGFGVEVLSDQQKTAFLKNPHNSGRFIHTGFWATSRHPNYLGEIMLWCGIAIIGLGVFSGLQWLALISPFFVFVLLNHISAIPILEARARRQWGAHPAFQDYVATVPPLMPHISTHQPPAQSGH